MVVRYNMVNALLVRNSILQGHPVLYTAHGGPASRSALMSCVGIYVH